MSLIKEGNSLHSATTGSGLSEVTSTTWSDGEYELRGFSNETAPVGKARSVGKALRPDCRIKLVYGPTKIYSDGDNNLVTERVGRELQHRAICLSIMMSNLVTCEQVYYEGQVMLVWSPDKTQKLFCTAKHNLVSEENSEGEFEECFHHFVFTPVRYDEYGNKIQASGPVTFSEKGWIKTSETPGVVLRDEVSWSSGVDISFGQKMHDAQDFYGSRTLVKLDKVVEPHQAIGNDFAYCTGMKIAVVIYSKVGPNKYNVLGVDDEAKIPFIFGEAKHTLILTGEITFIGEKHIEYNANTFGGCSGAAVILLEEESPDFLKVIAVHAGYKEDLETNIGFKLAGMFDDGCTEKKEDRLSQANA